MQYMELCVFSLPISRMMVVRIGVRYLITIIKSRVWPICHCLGLGQETMACAVSLLICWQTNHRWSLEIFSFEAIMCYSSTILHMWLSWDQLLKLSGSLWRYWNTNTGYYTSNKLRYRGNPKPSDKIYNDNNHSVDSSFPIQTICETILHELWASCQIRKIAHCACTGNTGQVFIATDFKGNR